MAIGEVAVPTEAPPVEAEAIDQLVPTEPSVEAEPSVETPSEPQEPAKVEEPEPQGDNRLISPELRKHLDGLKATAPLLAKQLRTAIFSEKAFRTSFPGGPQEAQKLKAVFDEAGGEQGLSDLKGDIEFYSGLEQKLASGDPNLAESMAEFNPQGFAKSVPAFVQKFFQVDPEGYQHMMAKVIDRSLQDSGVGNRLYLIEQTLAMGNAEEAKRLIGEVKAVFDGWGTLAKQAPAPKINPNQPDPNSQRQQELDQREGKLFNDGIALKVDPFKSDIIKKELLKHTGGKAVDEGLMEIVEDRVGREISTMLRSQPDFKAQFDRFLNAKDSAGLVKLMQSRITAVAPEAVKKIHRILFRGAATPTNGVKPTPPVNGKLNGQPPAAPQGWEKVAKMPSPNEINRAHGATTDDMIFNNRAILKSGKRVTW